MALFECLTAIKPIYGNCGPEPELDTKKPVCTDLQVAGHRIGCLRSQLDLDGEIEAMIVFPEDCSGIRMSVEEDSDGMVWVDLLEPFFSGDVEIRFQAKRD